jgi:hypothetical protein
MGARICITVTASTLTWLGWGGRGITGGARAVSLVGVMV